MRRVIFFLTYFLIPGFLFGQGLHPGEAIFGIHSWIEYIPGNFPIILSSPHGGHLKPEELRDRNCSGCVTGQDLNTQEVTRLVAEKITAKTGCYPHIIINRLHRIKMDANREVIEATDGHLEVEQSYREYHSFIDSARRSVGSEFGKGLFIDIHGHGHAIQRLELGYLLSRSDLQLSDDRLNENSLVVKSSVRHLVMNNDKHHSLSEVVRGRISLGSLMDSLGFPAVPSFFDPFPQQGDDYFTGGFNTREYGSRDGGTVDGIQIECNFKGVRDTEQNRVKFADALSTALIQFLDQYLFSRNLTECLPTSFEEPHRELLPFLVYPNPTCGEWKINSELVDKIASVTVIGSGGRTILIRKPKAINSLPILPPGVYFMRIQLQNQVQTQKLIVKACH